MKFKKGNGKCSLVSNKPLLTTVFIVLLFLAWLVLIGPGPSGMTRYEKRGVRAQPLIKPYNYPMNTLNVSDYVRLMNLTDFDFTILPKNVCNATHPAVIVLVHSAAVNADRRQNIRKTWATASQRVRILFVLAAVQSKPLQHIICTESTLYSDIVQANFLDRYVNLTYKHATVFKYAIYHCPHAKYVLKVDDDIYVNVKMLLRFVDEELAPNGMSNLLFCSVSYNNFVDRKDDSKWQVSFADYPYSMFPPYCPGTALLYSQDVVFKLYTELQNGGKFFWIDDVFITGMLLRTLDIRHMNARNFRLDKRKLHAILIGELDVPMEAFIFTTQLKGLLAHVRVREYIRTYKAELQNVTIKGMYEY